MFGQDWGISDWFQGVKDSILKLNLGQWAADAKEQTLKFFGETWSQLKTGWGEGFFLFKRAFYKIRRVFHQNNTGNSKLGMAANSTGLEISGRMV